MTHYWKVCYVELPQGTTLAGTHPAWFCVKVPDFVVMGPNGVGPPVPPEPPEFEGTGLTTEDIKALQALATIDRISQGLPGALSHGIQGAVDTQMKGLGHKLKQGFKLSRSEVTA